MTLKLCNVKNKKTRQFLEDLVAGAGYFNIVIFGSYSFIQNILEILDKLCANIYTLIHSVNNNSQFANFLERKMNCICVSKIGLAFAVEEAIFIKFCYQDSVNL